jgi:signal peptidase I
MQNEQDIRTETMGMDEPPAVVEVVGEAPPPARGLWGELRSTVLDMAQFAMVALIVVTFVAQPVKVEGTSMLPRLHDGERIIINKFLYSLDGWPSKSLSIGRSVERGDIVVFYYPNDPNVRYVKRVIGLPGDSVRIDRDGRVYVNSQRLDEPYLDSEYTQLPDAMQSVTVKEHYYFVMGDNRDNSSDSRSWGLVPEKYICGEAWFRVWPLTEAGSLGQ